MSDRLEEIKQRRARDQEQARERQAQGLAILAQAKAEAPRLTWTISPVRSGPGAPESWQLRSKLPTYIPPEEAPPETETVLVTMGEPFAYQCGGVVRKGKVVVYLPPEDAWELRALGLDANAEADYKAAKPVSEDAYRMSLVTRLCCYGIPSGFGSHPHNADGLGGLLAKLSGSAVEAARAAVEEVREVSRETAHVLLDEARLPGSSLRARAALLWALFARVAAGPHGSAVVIPQVFMALTGADEASLHRIAAELEFAPAFGGAPSEDN